jgi:hypothetical protein
MLTPTALTDSRGQVLTLEPVPPGEEKAAAAADDWPEPPSNALPRASRRKVKPTAKPEAPL